MKPFSIKESITTRPSLARWTLALLLIQPFAPVHAEVLRQRGVASWHDPRRGDRRTASQQTWIGTDMIAAHRTLPLGSKVRVVNLANGHSVIVKILDRGPYAHGRIIDVSRRAAQELGLLTDGTAKVRLETVPGDTPL